MRKLLALILLLTSPAFGQNVQPGEGHVWERAAYGDIPGLTYVELRGRNGAPTTTFEPLWGESAAYTLLTAALSSPYCASTDAADDSGSTGAETATVTGVTYTAAAGYDAFSEDIILDGQTSVTLTTSAVYFINSVTITGAGSGFTNAGVVACGTGANTSGDPAVIHSYMAIGDGSAHTAMYAVPDDHSLVCRNWTLTSYDVTAAETVEFVVDSYTDPVADKVRVRRLLGHLNQAGASSFVNPQLIKFPEKTVVIAQALSAASTGPVGITAECLLIKDSWQGSAQTLF